MDTDTFTASGVKVMSVDFYDLVHTAKLLTMYTRRELEKSIETVSSAIETGDWSMAQVASERLGRNSGAFEFSVRMYATLKRGEDSDLVIATGYDKDRIRETDTGYVFEKFSGPSEEYYTEPFARLARAEYILNGIEKLTRGYVRDV